MVIKISVNFKIIFLDLYIVASSGIYTTYCSITWGFCQKKKAPRFDRDAFKEAEKLFADAKLYVVYIIIDRSGLGGGNRYQLHLYQPALSVN